MVRVRVRVRVGVMVRVRAGVMVRVRAVVGRLLYGGGHRKVLDPNPST